MRYKNINKLNNEISKLIILKANEENKLKDLEYSILKANNFHELPPDTSRLHDETIIKFIEQREEITEKIKNIDKRINELNSQIDNITNAVKNMPDCNIKTIMDMFFIQSESMEYIIKATGYSRSSIYGLIRTKGGDY